MVSKWRMGGFGGKKPEFCSFHGTRSGGGKIMEVQNGFYFRWGKDVLNVKKRVDLGGKKSEIGLLIRRRNRFSFLKEFWLPVQSPVPLIRARPWEQ